MSSHISQMERFDVVILGLIIDSLLEELHQLWSEIIPIERIVDRRLQESELVTSIIAISLHLEPIDLTSILYHPLECISKAYLPIFTSPTLCSLISLFEIVEYLWSDDVFSDDTETRGGFFGFWLFEELRNSMDRSLRYCWFDDTI